MIAPVESRVARWLRCPEKTCCSYYTVFITGDDLTRIARTLSVPPWTFTAALPCGPDDFGAFALDTSDRRYRAALVRLQLEEGSKPFCTFLIRASDGAARCGLGAGRPATCRSFPAQLVDGAIQFATEGCTCDWSHVTPDAGDQQLLRAEEQARERYTHFVATWNEYVANLNRPAELAYPDFCRFLLDTYSA
jgi:Fe-S-cluster containining protein